MSTIHHTELLFSHLCTRLDQALRTGSLRATSVVHARLLKAGLLPYLGAKLFLSYAGGTPRLPSLPALVGLLDGVGPDVDADPSQWNAIVSALSRRESFSSLALRAFSVMHELGLPLCSYALCSGLAASSAERAVQMGKQIHAHAMKSGWVAAVFVGGALVNLYVKLGALEAARSAFDEIPLKNTTCVNTLLVGYVEAKLWFDCVTLVQSMHGFRSAPDGFTLSTVLRMCAEVPAARLGMQAHAYLIRRAEYLEEDVFVQSSPVEMYGKCGLVDEAQLVFGLAGNIAPRKTRDVVLWTSMLNAFGRNGRSKKVIETFEEMLNVGTKPDEVAFVAVLTACSRTGEVNRGLDYFKSMKREHRIRPWPEHYGCIVDLLCKAGELEKAWKFANDMVLGTGEDDGRARSVRVWGTLLSSCKEFDNVKMGRLAAQRALELDPFNVGIYMELSNMYAKMGMWDEIEQLREHVNRRGLKKDVGYSWIELTR